MEGYKIYDGRSWNYNSATYVITDIEGYMPIVTVTGYNKSVWVVVESKPSNAAVIDLETDIIKLTKDVEIEGDLVYDRGVIDLNGHTLIVKGNLTLTSDPSDSQSHCTLNIGGGTLVVWGDFKMSEYSRLIMRNPNDYVLVNGNFETISKIDHKNNSDIEKGGDGAPCLTNGRFEVT